MPLRGGVKQQLLDDRPHGVADGANSDGKGNTMRSYATGGRKRAKTAGQFLTSLYLIGRLSAPELQEGAASQPSASSADPFVDSSGPLPDLAKCGNKGIYRKNMHQDIGNKLKRYATKPPVYATKITVWGQ